MQRVSDEDIVREWGTAVPLYPQLKSIIQSGSMEQDFDGRIREAFILLERRLREAAGLSWHDYGADLVEKAFKVPDGELQPVSPVRSEQDGIRELFRGAFLAYRNPAAHRPTGHNKQTAWMIFQLINQLLLTIDAATEQQIDLSQFVSPHEGKISKRKDFRLDVDGDSERERVILLDMGITFTEACRQNYLGIVILDKVGDSLRRLPCERIPATSMFGPMDARAITVTGGDRPDIVTRWSTSGHADMYAIHRWDDEGYKLVEIEIPNAANHRLYYFPNRMESTVAFVDFDGDGMVEVVVQMLPGAPPRGDGSHPEDLARRFVVWKWDATNQVMTQVGEHTILFRDGRDHERAREQRG